MAIAEPAELYALARFACNQIEKYTADLVLVGFPAGQGTLLAAQALWAVTRATPFPPVAAVHLTENMVGRFDDLPGRKSGRWLVTIGMGPLEIGRFMAWVHAQTAWQAELRAAVEAALGPGAAPDSVVVLGECDVDEVAAPLVLDLLAALYPEARTRYLAGPGSMLHGPGAYWPIPFADAWVNDAERTLLSWPPADDDAWRVFVDNLLTLVRGGQAPDRNSLVWAPVSTDDPLIERLSAYFPRRRCWRRRAGRLICSRGWSATGTAICAGRCDAGAQGARRRASPTLISCRLRSSSVASCGCAGASPRPRLPKSAGSTSHRQPRAWNDAHPGPAGGRRGAGVRTYSLRNEVGILAYGSLRIDPGPEFAPYVERRIAGTTPFPIEYVRSSPTHAGAPVLVPVPAGYGASAPAEVLVLAPEIDRETAGVLLQRRKLDRAGDDAIWFAADAEEMSVRELPGFAGLPVVLYAAGAPNLPEVIPDDMPVAERAKILAQLAIASLTPETYAAGHDGIRYLADAIAQGIVTPLTEPYRQAILRLTGAADLAAARVTCLDTH